MGCAEGAGGCGAWLGGSCGMGKELHSQHGAVEGGQGGSLCSMVMLERREPAQFAGPRAGWHIVDPVLFSLMLSLVGLDQISAEQSRSCSACGAGVERFKVDNGHGDGEEATPP